MNSLLRFVFLSFCASSIVLASGEGSVIQVSRSLAMNSTEPPPAKEYFIDMGTQDGVAVGSVLRVFRVHPIVNSRKNEPWELIHVPLGELEVTSVGTYSCVGRIVSIADPKSLPVLDYPGIMVGDFVEQIEPLPYF